MSKTIKETDCYIVRPQRSWKKWSLGIKNSGLSNLVIVGILRLSQVCFFNSDYLWLSVFYIRSSFILWKLCGAGLPCFVSLMLDSPGSPFSVGAVSSENCCPETQSCHLTQTWHLSQEAPDVSCLLISGPEEPGVMANLCDP